MRRLESSRLFFILEAIKRNPRVNRAEIDDKLQRKAEELQRSLEKGRASVKAIMEALQSHPHVKDLRETEPYSPQDISGLDIQVLFYSTNPFLDKLGTVWVQAKSSRTGVEKFIAHYGYAYLLEHKIIILVGRDSPDQIISNFEQQLQEIVYYHRFS